ncbi:MAG TPA: DUF3885 domain-containing protein [Longimicrobium sp.]|nr:DUF3885 domain-containing protein [Longimicrobium sp.]
MRSAFGARALGFALFHAHAPALRFELSRGGGHLEQFTQAYDRGREILHALFDDSDTLVAVLGFPAGERRRALRSVRDCRIHIPRPCQAWTETLEFDGEAEEWSYLAFAAAPELIDPLLWGAAAHDLGVRPRLECGVYLADPARGVLAHPYDDRGMDLVGRREALAEAYARFGEYLLDHDRTRMDGWFADGR